MKKFFIILVSSLILIAISIWFIINLLYKNVGIQQDIIIEIPQRATISE